MWTTSKAAGSYLPYARHGFQFLKNVMWDSAYGGFYNLVSREGKEKGDQRAPKDAYGNAFAMYALAAYYEASGDTAALNLAKTTFAWLEKHSHDPVHKGYYQNLQRNGDHAGPVYKDQNSSIHLLEAFTELYQVWKDPLLRERLQEMLVLIRDTIVTGKGYLQLFFQPDWTPLSFRDSSEAIIKKNKFLDHVSFGHDVETAYLMLEASHVLGIQNDAKTMAVAKKMVDHALQNGWDKKLGGFYDEGYYFKNKPGITILKDSKNWWAQAEGLNTLLMMADLYPKEGYYEKFKQMWKYIDSYIIDHEHGDWFEEGLDKEPQRRTALKGHIWKATYHQYRALSNCVQRLKKAHKI
jgi:mannobiose 2-epimerase